LKLRYDGQLLSDLAFNFKLRRYRKVDSGMAERRHPRRRTIANVPEPQALLNLRNEMRVVGPGTYCSPTARHALCTRYFCQVASYDAASNISQPCLPRYRQAFQRSFLE